MLVNNALERSAHRLTSHLIVLQIIIFKELMFSLLGLNFSAEQEIKLAYEYHYHDNTATVSD